jgi:hypothetical protein
MCTSNGGVDMGAAKRVAMTTVVFSLVAYGSVGSAWGLDLRCTQFSAHCPGLPRKCDAECPSAFTCKDVSGQGNRK